jgi:hypothetical protein
VIASGFNGIDQIALDEARGFAYVAEFTASQVQKIDLASGTATVVATTALPPRGVLLTSDGRFVYVSDDSSTITRFDLATNTQKVIASGLNASSHLTWADAGESVILFTQRNPVGTVLKLDLTASPASVMPIAGPTSNSPGSVAVLSPDQLLITCAQEINQVVLTDSVYSSAGPILLGIGFVPADDAHILNGYADTTADPKYFFQVKDCPFGGTLPLMINWQNARDQGANFYQVFIQAAEGPAVQVNQAFGDYRWSVPLTQFELVTTVPTGGYYPLRAAGEIWLNYWLGLLLNTGGQPNNLNTISIKLFSAQDQATEIGLSTDAGRHAAIMIDNTGPTAHIDQILHDDVPVGTCALVTEGSHTFTFQVVASAPRHLRGWSLAAYWGDNQSGQVASDDYSNHVATPPIWTGLTSVVVPLPGPTPWDASVAGDMSSIHCAHTFFLYAWDRVINGWGYIHGAASYHKSITLLF